MIHSPNLLFDKFRVLMIYSQVRALFHHADTSHVTMSIYHSLIHIGFGEICLPFKGGLIWLLGLRC